MSKVTVVAKLVANPDAVEQLKYELLKLITPTRHENGCLEYRLHQDNADPAVFIFYENWESRDCLDNHLATPHYRSYAAAVAKLIRDKTVHILMEIQ